MCSLNFSFYSKLQEFTLMSANTGYYATGFITRPTVFTFSISLWLKRLPLYFTFQCTLVTMDTLTLLSHVCQAYWWVDVVEKTVMSVEIIEPMSGVKSISKYDCSPGQFYNVRVTQRHFTVKFCFCFWFSRAFLCSLWFTTALLLALTHFDLQWTV
jgi:hypothetical protein